MHVSLVVESLRQALAYLVHGRLFEQDTNLGTGSNHPSGKVETQVFAEEHEEGITETLSEDKQFIVVGKVEERIIENDQRIGGFLEQRHEPCLVGSNPACLLG